MKFWQQNSLNSINNDSGKNDAVFSVKQKQILNTNSEHSKTKSKTSWELLYNW